MKYTEDHLWLRIEGDGVVLGITPHLAAEIGDAEFIELPEIETMVTRGDEIILIESGRSAHEIAVPLDGEVVAINEAVVEAPELVGDDPTGAAWLVRLAVDDLSVLDEFMDEDEYRESLE